MADNVTPSPTGGTATDKAKLVPVMDQLLRTLSDKVLNTETAVRENTAQVEVMAHSVELVRGIPDKVKAVEQRVAATGEAVGKLQERMESMEASVRQSMDGSRRLEGAIEALRMGLNQHAGLFEKPLHKSVHYRHSMDEPVWIIIVLFTVCVGLVALCFNYHDKADNYEASDIQWRGAQLITDSVTLHEMQALKNSYESNPDSVRSSIIGEEDRRKALAERIIERDQKNQEIDQLTKQRKQR